jgi:DHA1 family tetracycline resistance protein-like MFS transporter
MTQDGGGAAAQAGHSREDGRASRARDDAASDRSRQGRRRNALVFILVTILLDSMALGMVAPVLPKLITQVLAGHPLSPRIAQSLPGGGVALAAAVYGLFNTVFALMQFFFSPVIGSLSDRFGRRPLILASNIGLGLNYLLLAWAPNLVWLFVGRLLSGITGASFGTASAYIADTTPPERRSEAFGMVGAAFGLGLVIGPGLGGLLSDVSARLPFVVAGALSLANAAYGLLVLPESLPRSMRSGFSWKRANPVGSLILLRRHPDLFGLAGVAFLSNLAQVALGSTVVLYAMHRFGWTTGRVGVTLAVTGIAMALVQVFVVGPVVKRVGNRWTMIAGLSFGAVALFWAGVAPNQVLFWAGIPLIALWGLFGAANQTLMTRHVKPIEQGQLQGANASITGISELIGPLIFTLIFAYFVTPGHNIAEAGAPFLMGGLILSAAAIWGVISTRDEREPDV